MKKVNLKNIISLIGAMALANGVFAQEVVSTSNPNMHYYALTAIAVVLLIVIVSLNGAINSLASGKALWEKIGKGKLGAFLIPVFAAISAGVFAQDAAVSQDIVVVEPNYGLVFWMFLIVDLVLVIIVIVQLSTLNSLANTIKTEAAAEGGTLDVETEDFWSGLTDAVPIEREDEIMTDHEYDGIRELDNKLPPWWVWMFYLTIVFAVVYFGYYEIYKSTDMSVDEYQTEMAEAEAAKSSEGIDETNVVLVTETENQMNGKKVFETNCVSCHLNDGGGSIGPNLTDQYWLHGGSINDVFGVIKHGVPGKAMVSWKDLISPSDMQDVSSYILGTLNGSTPATAKAPEGELYTPKETP